MGPMMLVPIIKARKSLSALVADVERGSEVTITRHGVAVARLIPMVPAFDREKARRAAEGLRRASRGTTLGGIRIKDLVDEGRS